MKKHIFIAEDEHFNRMSLKMILQMAGYEVSVAEDGQAALEMIEEMMQQGKQPDLLVTDIQMPLLTGMELIDALSARDIRIPVLVMTGFGDKEMLIELMRRGCSEYIDKPFEPDDITARVKSVLEMQEKKRFEREKEIEKEKSEISLEMESYRMHFEKLRTQVNSAVESYKNLIQTGNIRDGFTAVYRHKPFWELGGDFLDMRPTDRGCDIFIADVAGHDMGASYHTVLLKAFFEENCRTGNDGQTFFQILNRQLRDNGKNERMVTALFLRLDTKNRKAEIVSAAHPPLLRIPAGTGEAEAIFLEGDVLGLHEEVVFGTADFSLAPGDRFFLYTDGLINAYSVDSESGKKQYLTEDGLSLLIQNNAGLPLEQLISNIEDHFSGISEYKLNDDMLILGLEIP
ncbi:MAG: SpoIIE family protein phosphatase [Desulfococcaceae bacterium]|jgi:DNA-binding response OmpR family regulator|nr:SpoIIE family protein phosphatase [Desulfococcaceae bacterium]